MLCLKIKVGDTLTIGEAKVVVRDTGRNHVLLAIDAPEEIPVVRDNAKQREAVPA